MKGEENRGGKEEGRRERGIAGMGEEDAKGRERFKEDGREGGRGE